MLVEFTIIEKKQLTFDVFEMVFKSSKKFDFVY
jgi:hypothetical protein